MLRAIDISLLSFNVSDRLNAIEAIRMLNKVREILIYYRSFGHPIGVSGDVILVLSSGGKYPDIAYIKNFIDSYDLGSAFEAHEISRAIGDILLNYESIDDSLKLKDYISDDVEIAPDISGHYLNSEEFESTKRLLVKMAVQSQEESDVGIFGSYSCDVNCRIKFEMGIDGNNHAILEDEEISANIGFIQPTEEAFSSHDMALEWANCEDATAVLNILHQLTGSSGVRIEICDSFFESLVQNGCIGNRKYSSQTFKICRSIISDSKKFKTNPFFSNNSRSIQAISHDGLLGWRVHVTGGGEAIRLMFWGDDNKIRFSVVGPKNECVIIDD